MTIILLGGWLALILLSYKGAEIILRKSNNL
jgi:hypothetical protein